jgi:hypothetical protein
VAVQAHGQALVQAARRAAQKTQEKGANYQDPRSFAFSMFPTKVLQRYLQLVHFPMLALWSA